MSTDDPSYKLDAQEFKRQFIEVDSLLEGVNPDRVTKWFRPGHGFFTKKMLDMVGKFGYKTALGGVYPHDPMIKIPSVNSFCILAFSKKYSSLFPFSRYSLSILFI